MNTIEIPELTITREVTEIQTIDLPDYPNFVKWVNIYVRGEDSEGKYGDINTVYSFDIFNLEETFIPFEQLTESIILNWADTKDSNQINWAVEYVEKNYVDRNFSVHSFNSESFPW